MALSKWKVNPHKRKIIAKGNGSSRHAGKSASVSITFQQSKIFIKRYFLRNKAAFLEPNVLVEKINRIAMDVLHSTDTSFDIPATV